jgi:hypothetical protein
LYEAHLAFLLLRPFILIILSVINFLCKDIRHQSQLESTRVISFALKGVLLYVGYPFMLFFGNYRMMNVVDFKNVLLIGYSTELLLLCFPMLVIHGHNANVLSINFNYGEMSSL